MTITYNIEQSEKADDSKEITVVEVKEVTTTKRISVSDLKRRHSRLLEEISRTQIEADKLVDEIQAINDDKNIALTIKDIPAKLVSVAAIK